jgi:hypothetical protein
MNGPPINAIDRQGTQDTLTTPKSQFRNTDLESRTSVTTTMVSPQAPSGASPTALHSLEALKIKKEALNGFDSTALRELEVAATTILADRSTVTAAKQAAKLAAGQAREVNRTHEKNRAMLVAETAVLMESVRSEAERNGKSILTQEAIIEALKIARTVRQKVGLLLRLTEH